MSTRSVSQAMGSVKVQAGHSDSPRLTAEGVDATARPRLELRLYVAAGAPNSLLAAANVRRLLEAADVEWSLETIDCLAEPMRALRDGVLVTPTLVKYAPFPQQTVIGTLGDAARLAASLGLDDNALRSGTYD